MRARCVVQVFVIAAFVVAGSACAGRRGRRDGDAARPGEDASSSRVDASVRMDASLDAGASRRDAGRVEARDGAVVVPDAGRATWDAGSDAGVDVGRDAGADAGSDAGADAGRDAGNDAGFDAGHTGTVPGLSTACANGPGSRLFAFHFDGSNNPIVDTWDATCSYSLAPGSACNVVMVSPSDVAMGGYAAVVGTTTPYLRVRYSVAGLSFTNAALYVQARSYATSASTNIRAWSPIRGERTTGPVDVDFTYDWYWLGWTSFVSPADDPALTAIQLYASGGSGSLAIHAVELCVE